MCTDALSVPLSCSIMNSLWISKIPTTTTMPTATPSILRRMCRMSSPAWSVVRRRCSHFRSRGFACGGRDVFGAELYVGMAIDLDVWRTRGCASIAGYYQRRYVVTLGLRNMHLKLMMHFLKLAFSKRRSRIPLGLDRSHFLLQFADCTYGHERLELDSCHSLNTSRACNFKRPNTVGI